jgi:hypothetical protein
VSTKGFKKSTEDYSSQGRIPTSKTCSSTVFAVFPFSLPLMGNRNYLQKLIRRYIMEGNSYSPGLPNYCILAGFYA